MYLLNVLAVQIRLHALMPSHGVMPTILNILRDMKLTIIIVAEITLLNSMAHLPVHREHNSVTIAVALATAVVVAAVFQVKLAALPHHLHATILAINLTAAVHAL